MKYIFHHDASHGWLQVPRRELLELGIEHQITAYSYQYLDIVYLEEDDDASTFINALKARGQTPNITERYDGDTSNIRRFQHYEVTR